MKDPHPEGVFPCTLIEFEGIVEAQKPPYCFLRARLHTEHGQLFGHLLGTYQTLKMLQACETFIRVIPLQVRVRHNLKLGKLYISAELEVPDEHRA